MFRAVPMVLVRAVVLEQDERAVLRGLGALGVVELAREEPGPDTAPLPPRERSEELARWGRVASRVEAIKGRLGERPGTEGDRTLKMTSGPAKMTLHEVEERLAVMEERIAVAEERRRQLVERRRELVDICARSSHFRGLDIPLDGDDRFSFLHFVTGTLPVGSIEALEKRVEADRGSALFLLGGQEGRRSVLAVTTKQGRSGLEKALDEASFQPQPLPLKQGATIDSLCEEGERELQRLEAESEALQTDLNEAAAELERPLHAINALADVETRLIEAGQKFPRTDTAVLLTGWAPEHTAQALERRMKEITGGRYALETVVPDRPGEDRVPVLLHHSWLLRPFEALVSTYGLPRYRELEPTLFVALSYVLMFGAMFGDAGHGLVLASGGLLVLARGSKKTRDAGLLLLFAGLASIVSGAVYGSYFGIEALKKYAFWHDPLEGDPIRLMLFAIGFGIVMISVGLILNVINRFRRADVVGAVLDKFGLAGVLFYWGALALLVDGPFFESHGLTTPALATFVGLPVLAWVAKEPLEHLLARRNGRRNETGGMAEAVTESLVSAFEAVLGYLANTISFVRLAAYAMSHAALLVAAFMLAAQVRDFPFGGGFWSVTVAVLGNVIAIVLEGIIASVQALRLEYYEFFGKFFSGSGRPFEPFRLTAQERAPA